MEGFAEKFMFYLHFGKIVLKIIIVIMSKVWKKDQKNNALY